MTRKPRTLTGFALFLILAFYAFAFAGSCGVIGHALAHVVTALVGTAGSVMIAVVLGALGVRCLTPLLATPVRQRQAARRMVRSALNHVLREPVVEVLPPPQRMKIEDARSALKNLGYLPREIEPVVAQMDPTQPLEVLVRGGLKALQKAGN